MLGQKKDQSPDPQTIQKSKQTYTPKLVYLNNPMLGEFYRETMEDCQRLKMMESKDKKIAQEKKLGNLYGPPPILTGAEEHLGE
jgi:hypothetical protein